MKTYPIAESDADLTRATRAYRIDEFRQPLLGEWYLSGAVPEAYRASTSRLSTKYHICKPITYCNPSNAGLCSETSAVARRIGKLFDALDTQVNSYVVGNHDEILADIQSFRDTLRTRLEAEGWTVGYTDGSLEATDKCKAYAPDSPTGKKIRKWRDER